MLIMKNRLLIVSILLMLTKISWSQIHSVKGINGANVSSIVSKGSRLFAGTSTGQIYFSDDTCKSWTKAAMPYAYRYGFSIGTLFVDGNRVFASCGNAGAYYSDDDCKTWTQVNIAKPNTVVTGIVKFGSDLYFSTNTSGIFKSSNHGLTLDTLQDPLTRTLGIKDILKGEDGLLYSYMIYTGDYMRSVDGYLWETIYGADVPISILVLEDRILLSSNTDIYYSDDNWKTNKKTSLPDLNPNARNHFLYKGSNAIFLFNNYGIYRSFDKGSNWTKLGLSRSINKMIQFGTKLIATSGSGIYVSNDNGDSWEKENLGLVEMQYLSYSKLVNTHLLADKKLGIFSSDDNGKNWKNILSNMPYGEITSMTTDFNQNIYSIVDGLLYSSSNMGDFWQVDTLKGIGTVLSMSYFQKHLMYTNNSHQLISYNIKTHETEKRTELTDYEFTYSIANKLFAFNSLGMYVSNDINYVWSSTYPKYGFSAYTPFDVSYDNSTLIFNYLGSFLVSKDEGKTWTKQDFSGTNIRGIVISNNVWLSGGADVIFSNQDGAKWNSSKAYFNNSLAQLYPIFAADGNLFFSKAADGLFYRSDFTSVDEVSLSKEFKIYPNPCADKLQISAKNVTNIDDVSLFDLAGKQLNVTIKKETNNTVSLDMSGMKAGIYILKVDENSFKIVHY